ncbi:unnamed protein product [Mycena citricolor]|uniref:Uncharacterized protein n=1 Tax=Mycena citricolor TaxID=2018698 RepID=A0AAD2HYM8_9AGAR|nr:unnamed protein product [Mycena citricolor]
MTPRELQTLHLMHPCGLPALLTHRLRPVTSDMSVDVRLLDRGGTHPVRTSPGTHRTPVECASSSSLQPLCSLPCARSSRPACLSRVPPTAVHERYDSPVRGTPADACHLADPGLFRGKEPR